MEFYISILLHFYAFGCHPGNDFPNQFTYLESIEFQKATEEVFTKKIISRHNVGAGNIYYTRKYIRLQKREILMVT